MKRIGVDFRKFKCFFCRNHAMDIIILFPMLICLKKITMRWINFLRKIMGKNLFYMITKLLQKTLRFHVEQNIIIFCKITEEDIRKNGKMIFKFLRTSIIGISNNSSCKPH